jgi:hypothetical protein
MMIVKELIPVFVAVITGGCTLFAVWITSRFNRSRELKAWESKRLKDRFEYIQQLYARTLSVIHRVRFSDNVGAEIPEIQAQLALCSSDEIEQAFIKTMDILIDCQIAKVTPDSFLPEFKKLKQLFRNHLDELSRLTQ